MPYKPIFCLKLVLEGNQCYLRDTILLYVKKFMFPVWNQGDKNSCFLFETRMRKDSCYLFETRVKKIHVSCLKPGWKKFMFPVWNQGEKNSCFLFETRMKKIHVSCLKPAWKRFMFPVWNQGDQDSCKSGWKNSCVLIEISINQISLEKED